MKLGPKNQPQNVANNEKEHLLFDLQCMVIPAYFTMKVIKAVGMINKVINLINSLN